MRGGADELLLWMEKEAQKYIKAPKLQALLNWAKQATSGSEGDFKPAAKRAIAIANAIASANFFAKFNPIVADANAIARAIDNAIAIADARDNFTNTDNVIAIFRVFASIFLPHDDAFAVVINHVHELERLKIFNNVNFTVLITKLEALQAKAPDGKQPLKVHIAAFRNHVLEDWLNALNLSSELVNLSIVESQTLDDYFYATWLIVQCKQAAVRVSPATWKAIEERMLLITGD